MYRYIKGDVEETGKDFIVIDNNGIGYKIFVPPSTISRLGNRKQGIKVYTYYHVREDIAALYGFLTYDELNMFELLISVSGIGPKAGLSILSAIPPAKLGLSILSGDTKSLTAVPGIGNKTAHRIILELKDKIARDDVIDLDTDNTYEGEGSINEAVNALISLGYSAAEANDAVRKADPDAKDTESIIKSALKILMK